MWRRVPRPTRRAKSRWPTLIPICIESRDRNKTCNTNATFNSRPLRVLAKNIFAAEGDAPRVPTTHQPHRREIPRRPLSKCVLRGLCAYQDDSQPGLVNGRRCYRPMRTFACCCLENLFICLVFSLTHVYAIGSDHLESRLCFCRRYADTIKRNPGRVLVGWTTRRRRRYPLPR
jgi:hypothetical protein